MRSVSSDELAAFASIHDEAVELVSVQRPLASQCEPLARRLIDSRQAPHLRWVQPAGDCDAAAAALPPAVDHDVRAMLAGQVAEAGVVLGELMGCREVKVRMETLSAPMCPRFHVDHLPCRLLITLSGAGTEWISNGDVDWAVFADPDAMAPPVKADGQVYQLDTGHWSLLKGGAWTDAFSGVVHRSPHGDGERLLLSLDPVV